MVPIKSTSGCNSCPYGCKSCKKGTTTIPASYSYLEVFNSKCYICESNLVLDIVTGLCKLPCNSG